jgi:hypothetical protein
MNSKEADKSGVAQYVAAFNRGDSEGLRSLFTADALVQGILGSASLDIPGHLNVG